MAELLQEAEPRTIPRSPVVVCVDDDPRVLSALRRALGREPFELLTTEAPSQALTWIDERNVDLVIADLRMPDMSGADLLEAVNDRSPSTRRMMLTAYPSSARIIRSMRHGVQWLMEKPWEDAALKSTIRTILEGQAAAASLPEGATRRCLVVPVDCRGRTPGEALEAVAHALETMRRASWGCQIVLENLPLLQGSASRFLIEIGRHLDSEGIRASIVESTGMAQAFLDALGGMNAAGKRDPPPGA